MQRLWCTSLVAIGVLSNSLLAQAANCTSQALTPCSGHGVCLDPPSDASNATGSHCLCFAHYLTWPEDQVPGCNYRQWPRLVPFLLQLFLGWFSGAGVFLCGQVGYGVLQLLWCWCGLVPLCVASYLPSEHRPWCHGTSAPASCYVGLWLLAVVVLNVVLLVELGTGELTDYNGAPLGDW